MRHHQAISDKQSASTLRKLLRIVARRLVKEIVDEENRAANKNHNETVAGQDRSRRPERPTLEANSSTKTGQATS